MRSESRCIGCPELSDVAMLRPEWNGVRPAVRPRAIGRRRKKENRTLGDRFAQPACGLTDSPTFGKIPEKRSQYHA